MKRSGPLNRKTWMKRESPRLSKAKKDYAILKKGFWAQEKNAFCPVARVIFGRPRVPATEVHHMKGREGKMLNDVEFWLAVSREGHRFIHDHPNQARKHGWLV